MFSKRSNHLRFKLENYSFYFLQYDIHSFVKEEHFLEQYPKKGGILCVPFLLHLFILYNFYKSK